MYGGVRYHIEIDAPVEAVWDRIGDPARLHEWFPDFSASPVDGTTRTIVSNSGVSIDEELLIVDPLLRRIQYSLNLPILAKHHGTLDAIGLEDGRTLLMYTTDTEPRIMSLVIGSATARGLREIKRQMEESH